MTEQRWTASYGDFTARFGPLFIESNLAHDVDGALSCDSSGRSIARRGLHTSPWIIKTVFQFDGRAHGKSSFSASRSVRPQG